MTAEYYLAFEKRFRGGRDLIKERLQVYQPFIKLIKQHYPTVIALDLGCGRGEWLELLRENNIDGVGVDLDEGMLSSCRELGLNVRQQDAMSALAGTPDNSLSMLTGFHIAEHLSFDVLQRMIAEALRVLKPLGILILETPNPENIVVGASQFYLDPTHQKPLPKQLVAFLAEHNGFERVKTIGLNGYASEEDFRKVTLYDVLANASPDYAVIAQKNGSENGMREFDHAFSGEIGVAMSRLADLFESRLAKAEQRLAKAEQATEAIEKIKSTRLYRFVKKII